MITDRHTITSSKHTAEIFILSFLFVRRIFLQIQYNGQQDVYCRYLSHINSRDSTAVVRLFLPIQLLRDISSEDGELCSAPTHLFLFFALETDCLYSACMT